MKSELNGICQIEFLNSKGLGVGKSELDILELPCTAPGDTVEFQKRFYGRKSEYVVNKIINPSDLRSEPPCKYFGTCGGCLLQHLNEKTYTEFKQDQLLKALSDIDLNQVQVNPAVVVPPGNRRRANLEAIKKNGEVFLGFHKFHSHQIVNLDACIVLLPNLSKLLPQLKATLQDILEDFQKVQIFVTEAANGIDMSISIQRVAKLTLAQRDRFIKFAEESQLIRLTFRYRKLLDILWKIDDPYVIFDGCNVAIDAYCFLQSSPMSDRILADLVSGHLVKELHPETSTAIDLFCGRGTYTLPLSSRFKLVHGFESDINSLNALNNASYKYERDIKLSQRDLFSNPVTTAELDQYSAAVINPPRAGANNQVIELANSNISQIAYVSCNPNTFASDAKVLVNGRYKLISVTPIDQFYWSPHLEVVGLFSSIS